MARTRKPDHLKVISGTDQPCRIRGDSPEVSLADGNDHPPEWLSTTHARKEWERLYRILTVNAMLSEAALGMLGMLCEIYGQLVDGASRRNQPTGFMVAQYRGLCSDLGIAGSWRRKIGHAESPTPPTPKDNPFAQVGKRPGTTR